MHTLSLRELTIALQKKEFSSAELTQHYFNRIHKANTLNAFISIDEPHALVAANHADKIRLAGQAKRLTGIPLAHKDLFCTTTLPTTCGSKMLETFYAPYQATIVKKLSDEGTVLLGKTNMDEFAMGASNENSYFGAVRNPWNLAHVPGGSSGGSAAAVAAGLVPFATGSDTGGSIRQPAAFCGLSGLKPTYGLVSRFGMIAYASSLEQAGPLARSAEDLALILEIMAGHDAYDSTSADHPIPKYSEHLHQPVKSMRIGVPSCLLQKNVSTDNQDAIHNALRVFEDMGADIVQIDLPLQPLWAPCYYAIACAEASSNLSRYDGIRFGHRTAQANTLTDLITRSRTEGFGLEVKRRILTGTQMLSSGYYNDYYVQAQKIRRMIQQEILKTLNSVDVIVSPTTPTCAPLLGETITDPCQRYWSDGFTVAANLSGLPALSIPAGFSEGLPIGMQLLGAHFSEAALLSLAHQYQQITHWHQARPNTL